MRFLMRGLHFLYSGLRSDPFRFAVLWNLIVTSLQLLLTLILAFIFGVNQ